MNNVKLATTILREIEADTGFRLSDLRGYRKTSSIAKARKEAIRRVRSETEMSYPEIGELFCRDHSNIIYHCKN